MSDLEIWVAIGLMTLATILTRCSFFFLGSAERLPEPVKHALRFAPAAALAAIIAPDLLLDADKAVHIDFSNYRLLAAVAATLFFLWRGQLLGTIIVGMAAFTVLRLVF